MSDAPEKFSYEASEQIRQIALSLPDAEEGTSCVNRAFHAGGKNFLFLGEKDGELTMRMKLHDALSDIESRSQAAPSRYDIGKFGWVFFRFDPADIPGSDELTAWIHESFTLLAPKKLVARMPGSMP